MELYKLPDIKTELEELLMKKDISAIRLETVLFSFLDKLDENLRLKLSQELQQKYFPDIKIPDDNLFSWLKTLFQDFDTNKKQILDISQILAENSDVEDFCEYKIYIVIKDFYSEGNDLVKEYSSWDEADKDVDEWYTSCCDDLYLAENMLFPILCSVREKEFDFTMNYCTVFEFTFSNIEEGRESWEAQNHEK